MFPHAHAHTQITHFEILATAERLRILSRCLVLVTGCLGIPNVVLKTWKVLGELLLLSQQ